MFLEVAPIGLVAITLRIAIEGDARYQMMQGMPGEVAGEPVEPGRHPHENASPEGGLGELPRLALSPVGILILMLNVIEPDAHRRTDKGDGDLNQQERLEADSNMGDQQHA